MSVGLACLDDTLVGVDGCREGGAVMLIVGLSAMSFGALGAFTTYHSLDLDADDDSRLLMEQQHIYLALVEIAMSVWVWSVVCLGRDKGYGTCPGSVGGGVLICILSSGSVGFALGIVVRLRKILGCEIRGVRE